MPIHVNCVDCCVELTFPDSMAGRQVRCPTCEAEFIAPGSPQPVAAAVNGGSRPVREERIRATRPPQHEDVPEVEAVEAVEPVHESPPARDERVRATKPSKREREVARAVPESDVELVEETEDQPPDEPQSQPDGAGEKPRKKKRKKKRKAEATFPAWAWWLISGGVGIVGVFTFFLVLVIGLKQDALGYVIALVIMMPVSMVIMVVSMFVTSALGGGVDFGDARVAIPKAAALLFVINVINISPCGIGGYWVTLPIWIFGLMILFKLDFWEARILFILNWGCNCVLRWIVIALLVSAATHMHEHPEQYRKKGPSADDVMRITELGGEFEYGKGADHPVIGIKLRGPQVKDYHLDLVQGFPDLQSLDLGRSCLTDGGLAKIAEMHQLKEVVVAQTLVSGFGIAKLQQDRPDLKIVK